MASGVIDFAIYHMLLRYFLLFLIWNIFEGPQSYEE